MCHHILPYYSVRQPIPGIKHLDMLLYQYCYIALTKTHTTFTSNMSLKKDKILYKSENFTLLINFHKFIVIMNDFNFSKTQIINYVIRTGFEPVQSFLTKGFSMSLLSFGLCLLHAFKHLNVQEAGVQSLHIYVLITIQLGVIII